MLQRIRLAGYKSVRDATVTLGRLNVLIGGNGAGKSNFISAFRLLQRIVQGELQHYVNSTGGGDALLHFGRRATAQLQIELWWDTTNSYHATLTPTNEGSLLFADERAKYDTTGRDFPLARGERETGLVTEANRGGQVAGYVLQQLKRYRVYHFHDTSANAPVKQFCSIHDNLFLQSSAENLAAFLLRLRQEDAFIYGRIVKAVRLAAPFFADFVLEPLAQDPSRTMLRWREVGSDVIFTGHDLSDGTLRFICLATLLLQPSWYAAETIVIDEPELGLHPYAITLLAALLRGAGDDRQVIAATQSAPLVDELEPEDLIIVDRQRASDGRAESTFRRLDVAAVNAWLGEYTLGQLWRKNVLGASPGGLPVAATSLS